VYKRTAALGFIPPLREGAGAAVDERLLDKIQLHVFS
jgi:hypothetical protein